MRLPVVLALAATCILSPALEAQSRPRPQFQCGPQPSLDTMTTAGARWLSCNHNYWSSVYLAAKLLSRYEGIESNCLEQYSEVYKTAAMKFLRGEWAEANQAKAALTCAAGRQVRIDSEAISMLCVDQRWTPENAGLVNCPDRLAQMEQVNLTGWSEEIQNGYILMIRNNSAARTARITEWTVYDCLNVKGSICGQHTKPIVLRPGESTDLGRVQQDYANGGLQYRWNWRAEFLDN